MPWPWNPGAPQSNPLSPAPSASSSPPHPASVGQLQKGLAEGPLGSEEGEKGRGRPSRETPEAGNPGSPSQAEEPKQLYQWGVGRLALEIPPNTPFLPSGLPTWMAWFCSQEMRAGVCVCVCVSDRKSVV